MSRFKGMTTNERLCEAGLLEAFDAAIRRRDRVAAEAILEQVELPHPEAEAIVRAVLKNPKFYGY